MSELKNNNTNLEIRTSFYDDIRGIINESKATAIRSVDFQRVAMYWRVGERIFVEEQQGKERAGYGTCLIKKLAKTIEPEFGSGFSVRQMELCRQFYHTESVYNVATVVNKNYASHFYNSVLK